MHDAVAAPPGGNVSTGTPALIVEIDFANDPTVTTRTWTDITSDVRTISYTSSGRQHELQRTEAGTLTCTLSNRAGKYDPSNTASPYWPGVKRTRWIRVRSVWNSVVYSEWQGLIQGFSGEWPSAGMDATTTVVATDSFLALNLFDLNGYSYPEQTTGQRVAAVAADTQVSTGNIDIGVSTLPAITFTSSESALSHLQAVEDNEAGIVFVAADGTLAFHDRHHRAIFNATSVATIGDLVGEIPYSSSARFELDDNNIWNRIVVTAAGEPNNVDSPVPQLATDTASIASHYERTLTKTLLSDSQNDALAAAQFYVAAYAEPSERIPGCEVIGRAAPAVWPYILGAANSDRFLWVRRPSTEASPRTISLPVFLERKTTTITTGNDWRVNFQFTPADARLFWRLGVAGYSELADTTVLGF